MPTTRPRRAVNQRAAMVADSTVARKPVPDADQHAPHQDELPRVAHQRGGGDADADHRQRAQHRAADAEPVHHGGGERADAAVQDEVDRDRERDGGARPVELLLQRHHQDAGGRADAGAGQQHQAGDADDDPAVVDFVGGWHEGSASFLTQDGRWINRGVATPVTSAAKRRRSTGSRKPAPTPARVRTPGRAWWRRRRRRRATPCERHRAWRRRRSTDRATSRPISSISSRESPRRTCLRGRS